MKNRTIVIGGVKVGGAAEVDDVVIDGQSVKDRLAELERRMAELEAAKR